MPSVTFRWFWSVVFLILSASTGRLMADLVWTPETGWRIEGGVISALDGADASNALSLMNQARTAEEAGEKRRAIKLYKRVAKKYPTALYASEANYRLGRLYSSRKQYTKSFTAFQAVISTYPGTPHFTDIIGEQYRIASLLLDGARGRIFGIFPGFTNREKAVEYFEVIIFNAPYSDYAPLAMMNIARGHQRLGNTDEAIDALDRMINAYPQSLLTPDAYINLAKMHAKLVGGPYYDQGSTREAVTYYEDFMILFPGDNNVADAERGLAGMKRTLAESKMKIADFYFRKRDNYKAARVFYNEAITVYPDSEVAVRARERLAEVEEAEKAAEGGPRKKRFWIF